MRGSVWGNVHTYVHGSRTPAAHHAEVETAEEGRTAEAAVAASVATTGKGRPWISRVSLGGTAPVRFTLRVKLFSDDGEAEVV